MRAFIALELPDDFALDVAGLARQLKGSVEGRFMPPENHHVTLAFLGDVDERTVASAMAVLDDAARTHATILLRCSGLGTFGRKSDATLWLGLVPEGGLADLAAAVREGLAERGVDFDEKAFKPHITLARRARIPEGALDALPFPFDDAAATVTLFKSELSSSGATYKPLYSVELQK